MGALLVPHCCLQLLDNLKDIMQYRKGLGHLYILSRPGPRWAVHRLCGRGPVMP